MDPNEERAPRQWGSVARKGTRELGRSGPGPASQAWQGAMARARGAEQGSAPAPARWEPERWVEDDEVAAAPRRASRRDETPVPAAGRRRRRSLPPEVGAELAAAVGPSRATRMQARLAEATRAYERDRYREALALVKPMADAAPESAAVRELLGLIRYRLGHWNEAVKDLEAFRTLSGSYDQHPALADSYRAVKRWKRVEEVWDDLRQASPGSELVAEGRIVAAGALADRGRAAEAIELLESARTDLRRPRLHHLRTWYVLGDLYERAGEVSRARELFRRVLDHDPDLYDAAERLAAIG